MEMKPDVFINNLVQWITAAVTSFLGLRFVLRLFNANITNDFVAWVYDNTRPLLEPFLSIFPNTRQEGGFSVEFSTLFAILIYAVFGYLILSLVASISGVKKPAKK